MGFNVVMRFSVISAFTLMIIKVAFKKIDAEVWAASKFYC